MRQSYFPELPGMLTSSSAAKAEALGSSAPPSPAATASSSEQMIDCWSRKKRSRQFQQSGNAEISSAFKWLGIHLAKGLQLRSIFPHPKEISSAECIVGQESSFGLCRTRGYWAFKMPGL